MKGYGALSRELYRLCRGSYLGPPSTDSMDGTQKISQGMFVGWHITVAAAAHSMNLHRLTRLST